MQGQSFVDEVAGRVPAIRWQPAGWGGGGGLDTVMPVAFQKSSTTILATETRLDWTFSGQLVPKSSQYLPLNGPLLRNCPILGVLSVQGGCVCGVCFGTFMKWVTVLHPPGPLCARIANPDIFQESRSFAGGCKWSCPNTPNSPSGSSES